MKKFYFLIAVFLSCYSLGMGQAVTFIGNNDGSQSFTGNQGGGVPLFGECVPNGGSDIFLDWKTFNGGSGGDGQTTVCRAIVRGMTPNTDGQSLVASDVVCIADGNFVGDNGNDDQYFVNLNVCNLPDGRYSVEIQCDEAGGDYNNSSGGATAVTTWDYSSASGAPTYYYGDPAGNCNLFDGQDIIQVETNVNGGQPPQLEYFNVGDADVYRTMVVINGLFMDLGKFQPGNPTLPGSLHDLDNLYDAGCVGIGSFPQNGFCSDGTLTLNGAETNVMKNNSCGNADVTGNRMFYRVYETGTAPPAFCSFNVLFESDCPGSNYITTFAGGGSCQSSGCQTQQRWQVSSLSIDLMDCSGATCGVNVDGSGTYVLEVYTETDIVDCGGTASTVREPATAPTDFYATSFVIFNEFEAAAAGCSSIGIICTEEQACDGEDGQLEITGLPDGMYDVTYTVNGGSTITMAGLTSAGGSLTISGLAPGIYNNIMATESAGCTTFTNVAGCTISNFE